MNLALIIAGGSGERCGGDTPKQFIPICGHPVIAYTLKKYQDHPRIDAICVVALAGWESYVRNVAEKYNISKLAHIATGGASGQESIYNGLCELAKHYAGDCMVLVHDAVRPIIPGGIIDDAIDVATKFGNAVSGTPCCEAIIHTKKNTVVEHHELKRAQAPQCMRLGELADAHKIALARGIKNSTTSATLMIELGRQIFWSKGSNSNIKLTTADDLETLRAIIGWNADEYNLDK